MYRVCILVRTSDGGGHQRVPCNPARGWPCLVLEYFSNNYGAICVRGVFDAKYFVPGDNRAFVFTAQAPEEATLMHQSNDYPAGTADAWNVTVEGCIDDSLQLSIGELHQRSLDFIQGGPVEVFVPGPDGDHGSGVAMAPAGDASFVHDGADVSAVDLVTRPDSKESDSAKDKDGERPPKGDLGVQQQVDSGEPLPGKADGDPSRDESPMDVSDESKSPAEPLLPVAPSDADESKAPAKPVSPVVPSEDVQTEDSKVDAPEVVKQSGGDQGDAPKPGEKQSVPVGGDPKKPSGSGEILTAAGLQREHLRSVERKVTEALYGLPAGLMPGAGRFFPQTREVRQRSYISFNTEDGEPRRVYPRRQRNPSEELYLRDPSQQVPSRFMDDPDGDRARGLTLPFALSELKDSSRGHILDAWYHEVTTEVSRTLQMAPPLLQLPDYESIQALDLPLRGDGEEDEKSYDELPGYLNLDISLSVIGYKKVEDRFELFRKAKTEDQPKAYTAAMESLIEYIGKWLIRSMKAHDMRTRRAVTKQRLQQMDNDEVVATGVSEYLVGGRTMYVVQGGQRVPIHQLQNPILSGPLPVGLGCVVPVTPATDGVNDAAEPVDPDEDRVVRPEGQATVGGDSVSQSADPAKPPGPSHAAGDSKSADDIPKSGKPGGPGPGPDDRDDGAGGGGVVSSSKPPVQRSQRPAGGDSAGAHAEFVRNIGSGGWLPALPPRSRLITPVYENPGDTVPKNMDHLIPPGDLEVIKSVCVLPEEFKPCFIHTPKEAADLMAKYERDGQTFAYDPPSYVERHDVKDQFRKCYGYRRHFRDDYELVLDESRHDVTVFEDRDTSQGSVHNFNVFPFRRPVDTNIEAASEYANARHALYSWFQGGDVPEREFNMALATWHPSRVIHLFERFMESHSSARQTLLARNFTDRERLTREWWRMRVELFNKAPHFKEYRERRRERDRQARLLAEHQAAVDALHAKRSAAAVKGWKTRRSNLAAKGVVLADGRTGAERDAVKKSLAAVGDPSARSSQDSMEDFEGQPPRPKVRRMAVATPGGAVPSTSAAGGDQVIPLVHASGADAEGAGEEGGDQKVADMTPEELSSFVSTPLSRHLEELNVSGAGWLSPKEEFWKAHNLLHAFSQSSRHTAPFSSMAGDLDAASKSGDLQAAAPVPAGGGVPAPPSSVAEFIEQDISLGGALARDDNGVSAAKQPCPPVTSVEVTSAPVTPVTSAPVVSEGQRHAGDHSGSGGQQLPGQDVGPSASQVIGASSSVTTAPSLQVPHDPSGFFEDWMQQVNPDAEVTMDQSPDPSPPAQTVPPVTSTPVTSSSTGPQDTSGQSSFPVRIPEGVILGNQDDAETHSDTWTVPPGGDRSFHIGKGADEFAPFLMDDSRPLPTPVQPPAPGGSFESPPEVAIYGSGGVLVTSSTMVTSASPSLPADSASRKPRVSFGGVSSTLPASTTLTPSDYQLPVSQSGTETSVGDFSGLTIQTGTSATTVSSPSVTSAPPAGTTSGTVGAAPAGNSGHADTEVSDGQVPPRDEGDDRRPGSPGGAGAVSSGDDGGDLKPDPTSSESEVEQQDSRATGETEESDAGAGGDDQSEMVTSQQSVLHEEGSDGSQSPASVVRRRRPLVVRLRDDVGPDEVPSGFSADDVNYVLRKLREIDLEAVLKIHARAMSSDVDLTPRLITFSAAWITYVNGGSKGPQPAYPEPFGFLADYGIRMVGTLLQRIVRTMQALSLFVQDGGPDSGSDGDLDSQASGGGETGDAGDLAGDDDGAEAASNGTPSTVNVPEDSDVDMLSEGEAVTSMDYEDSQHDTSISTHASTVVPSNLGGGGDSDATVEYLDTSTTTAAVQVTDSSAVSSTPGAASSVVGPGVVMSPISTSSVRLSSRVVTCMAQARPSTSTGTFTPSGPRGRRRSLRLVPTRQDPVFLDTLLQEGGAFYVLPADRQGVTMVHCHYCDFTCPPTDDSDGNQADFAEMSAHLRNAHSIDVIICGYPRGGRVCRRAFVDANFHANHVALDHNDDDDDGSANLEVSTSQEYNPYMDSPSRSPSRRGRRQVPSTPDRSQLTDVQSQRLSQMAIAQQMHYPGRGEGYIGHGEDIACGVCGAYFPLDDQTGSRLALFAALKRHYQAVPHPEELWQCVASVDVGGVRYRCGRFFLSDDIMLAHLKAEHSQTNHLPLAGSDYGWGPHGPENMVGLPADVLVARRRQALLAQQQALASHAPGAHSAAQLSSSFSSASQSDVGQSVSHGDLELTIKSSPKVKSEEEDDDLSIVSVTPAPQSAPASVVMPQVTTPLSAAMCTVTLVPRTPGSVTSVAPSRPLDQGQLAASVARNLLRGYVPGAPGSPTTPVRRPGRSHLPRPSPASRGIPQRPVRAPVFGGAPVFGAVGRGGPVMGTPARAARAASAPPRAVPPVAPPAAPAPLPAGAPQVMLPTGPVPLLDPNTPCPAEGYQIIRVGDVWYCEFCGWNLAHDAPNAKQARYRHRQEHMRHICVVCETEYSRKDSLRKHFKSAHSHCCSICGRQCNSVTALRLHYSNAHAGAKPPM